MRLCVHIVCLALLAPVLRASTILQEHFDNDSLDPAWNVTLENATGWSFVESGSNLTVTDIAETVLNTGAGGTWARVILEQSFVGLTDFNIDFDFSWDSAGSVDAMQEVYLRLFDSTDTLIAQAGYIDAWILASGTRTASAGDTTFQPGIGDQPLAGSAQVDIVRTNDVITVLWDGTTILNETDATPISKVELHFTHYAADVASGTSFFGTESVDQIQIQGTAVPEPKSIGLLLLAGLGWTLHRRRTGRPDRAVET